MTIYKVSWNRGELETSSAIYKVVQTVNGL